MDGAALSLILEIQYFCIFKDLESSGSFSVRGFFVPESQKQISKPLKKAVLVAASSLFDAPLLPPSGKETARLKFAERACS